MIRITLSTILFILLLPLSPLLAQTETGLTKPELQVEIPTVQFSDAVVRNNTFSTNWIGEYVAGIYKYAIGITGIVAAVVLMGAGVMWLVAGGNTGRVQEAKEWIKAAVTGLVLALTSYVVLYTVNPALTTFNPIQLTEIQKMDSAKSNAARATYTGQSNWTMTATGSHTLDDARTFDWSGQYSPLATDAEIKAYIKSHEGFRGTAYADGGFYSIGYGHYLDGQDYTTNEARNLTISREQADELFERDYTHARSEAQRVASEHNINWDSLSTPRQAVLIDMAYNMGGGSRSAGTGLAGFDNTLRHLKNGAWEDAAAGMLNSRYATQVGDRAVHNAAVIIDGG